MPTSVVSLAAARRIKASVASFAAGAIEGLPWRDLNAATRAYRAEGFPYHTPRTAHRFAEVAFVRGQPQEIDETRERGQREVRQQDDTEADALLRVAVDRLKGQRFSEVHACDERGK
jgi:hypothetical protein